MHWWSGQAVRADWVAISSMAVRYPASLKLAVAHSEAGVADFELERPWMVTLLEIKLEIAKRLVDEHGQLLLATEDIDYLQLYSDTSHTLGDRVRAQP